MKILFVHPYFPGQFKHLVHAMLARGFEIVAIMNNGSDGRGTDAISNVRTLQYPAWEPRPGQEKRLIDAADNFVRDAVAAARQAQSLKSEGWLPELIYTHSGWGTAVFLKEIFPRAQKVSFCEWYYTNSARTTGYLNPARSFESKAFTSLLNSPILLDTANADALVSPTTWQRSQFPSHLARLIKVIPDGIDCQLVRPNIHATIDLPSGLRLRRGDRIVTYVARGADRFRGFGQFLRALEQVQKRDTRVHALIVGDRKSYYGADPGDRYYNEALSSVSLDESRTHFLGRLDYIEYLRVLQVSAVHVYLTVPFVLSWSLLEAMAAGCLVVASGTPPVREFIIDGQEGILCNFFEVDELSENIMYALDSDSPEIRTRARSVVKRRWSHQSAVKKHFALLEELVARKLTARQK